ncbi:F0F1 ATP synthase subunit epsilon [Candidatus Erwinia haradaeae]|uniref:ATP synthase epsilon chain n=1 Tax=Candidatus Erwinia haradaeae TaxID=1922217 RepID=A0A803FSU0_9GAMM|nr:F0F1 ATP synthase subunit epsilon [Candidatus Erwinia haradaeae]VFP87121.1 ATP synthase epsilon chain [Candidatus Erwinia haradaeae]
MISSFKLDVVSVELKIFSNTVQSIQVSGSEGELGIRPYHAPILTTIKPGMVRIFQQNGEREIIYLSGGILEAHRNAVIILADTAIRGHDLDEEHILHAQQQAIETIKKHHNDIDLLKASIELTKALAQLRVIDLIKKENINIKNLSNNHQ